jgi:organic radical activating enzyme
MGAGDNFWIVHCANLRNKALKKEKGINKYLLANFTDTLQQKDIEARTPLIDDYFRVKINVKSFDEEMMQKSGKHAIDFSDNKQVFDALANEFDMPYWAFMSLKNTALKDFNRTFIYQLKACNLYCPWCYVDDCNKDGKQSNGKYFSVPEIFDFFENEDKKGKIMNFRPSGGEPTLAVEQWLETLKEIQKRNLNIFVQGDTNLTTGHFLDYLEEKRDIKRNLLEKVGEYNNFGLLCSFKGTDKESFLEAAGMSKTFEHLEDERWHTFGKLTNAGIDAYPFIYAPNPKTLESFMEKGAKLFGDGFYLKTWLVKLKLYGPEKARLAKLGISSEDYQKKLDSEFAESKEIMQNIIWKKYGLNYQAVPRTGIKLKFREV